MNLKKHFFISQGRILTLLERIWISLFMDFLKKEKKTYENTKFFQVIDILTSFSLFLFYILLLIAHISYPSGLKTIKKVALGIPGKSHFYK